MGSSDTLFNVYWIALIASGIIMLAIAGTGFGGVTTGERAINGLFGLAFLGYGLYLGFLFDGGSYLIFFKAFIVPVLLVANAIRNAVTHRESQQAPPPMQGYPTNQPPAYPQGPTYPQPPAYPQPPYPPMGAQPPYPPMGAQPQYPPMGAQPPAPHPSQAYLAPPTGATQPQAPATAPYQSPIQPG
jgi:hypothetical protein